jgi:hypothetical protein
VGLADYFRCRAARYIYGRLCAELPFVSVGLRSELRPGVPELLGMFDLCELPDVLELSDLCRLRSVLPVWFVVWLQLV